MFVAVGEARLVTFISLCYLGRAIAFAVLSGMHHEIGLPAYEFGLALLITFYYLIRHKRFMNPQVGATTHDYESVLRCLFPPSTLVDDQRGCLTSQVRRRQNQDIALPDHPVGA